MSSAKSLNKVENLEKRVLRFLHNDYSTSYEVMKKHRECLNYQSLRIEIFTTLHKINPSFVKDIFKLRMTNRPTREAHKLNIETSKVKQVRSGTKTLRYLRPKVWNSLSYHIKPSINRAIFKILIKIGL